MVKAESHPGTNFRRAGIHKGFWVAAGSSLLVLLLLFTLFRLGYLHEIGFYISAIGILLSIATFYALFRSGKNLEARDPTLTIPQVACAMSVLTIAMYYTSSSARGVILPLELMAFVFGVFRLDTRKLLSLALFAMACYALMIALLLNFRANSVDFQLETLRVVIFGTILVWFAVMGGYVSKLRKTLRDSRDAMEEMATHDALTGSYNRRHLLAALEQEKLRSDRSGDEFCIGLIDLDFFKSINDRFGHRVGDEVLKACAECWVRIVRPLDCLGRYGGEEFEVLMTQTDLKGAQIVAQRLLAAVSDLRFPHIDPDLKVTASMGLAQYHRTESIDETERRADEALYRAKAAGRNRLEIETANHEKIQGKATLTLSEGFP